MPASVQLTPRNLPERRSPSPMATSNLPDHNKSSAEYTRRAGRSVSQRQAPVAGPQARRKRNEGETTGAVGGEAKPSETVERYWFTHLCFPLPGREA